LIELMVSLTIGLVIALAAMSAYLGAASSSKMADAQARMNEDAQAALNILAQQIRMAGANPVQANRADVFQHNPVFDPTYVGGTVTSYGNGTTSFTVSAGPSAFAIRGCDGTFSGLTTTTSLDSLSNCGTSALPDSIAVSYEADKYNTIPTSTNLPTDCVGNSVPAVTATFPTGTSTPTTASFTVADNRFYIASVSGVPSLYCKGNGGSTQPLVENVEDIQFMYGTVSTTATSTTATVAGYLDAAGVIALAPTANTVGYSTAWGKVLSVRICVVVRSENPVVPNAASGQYYKCDNSLDTSKTDLRLRRAYSTTVGLRNRRV
jgi:type IV pilus assembly protein PilW